MAYGSVKVDSIISSTKTLAVDNIAEADDLGTAAAEDVGTAAGNVVQLDNSARLPAVDGSQLTGLSAGTTNLTYDAPTREIRSSTGTDAVLPEATTTVAGLMSGTDKTKLDGIATGAEVNVNADWNASSGDAQILNKPSIPAAADAAPQALAATAAIGTSTDYAREDHVHQRDTDTIILACSDETTALTTGTNKVRFRMPFAGTLLAVRANCNTAPTGSTLIVDINEAGTSVLGTKLSIDASETTSTTAASAATITDSSLADDAEISVDIDQIGSTVAGAGLKVALVVRRS